MREIKFRAWTPNSQTMIGHREVIERAHLLFEGSLNSSDIVMQDTGFKDKNGTKIYEGYIVKTDTDNIVSVEYSNYYGAYLFGGFRTNQDEIYKLEIEVIGNIYENPELLDKN
jgi:hypothetical protein